MKYLISSLLTLAICCVLQLSTQAATITTLILTSQSDGDMLGGYTPGDYGSLQSGIPNSTQVGFTGLSNISPEWRNYGEFDLSTLPAGEVVTAANLHFRIEPFTQPSYDFDIELYTDANANGLIEGGTAGHNNGVAPNEDFGAGDFFVFNIAGSGDSDFSVAITGAALTELTTGPSFAGFEFSTNVAPAQDMDVVPHSTLSNGSGSLALEVTTTVRPIADVTATADTTFAFDDQSIDLNGTNSTDPDGNDANLSYTWSAQTGGQTSITALNIADSGITQPGGSAVVSLSVMDEEGAANDPGADAPDNSLQVSYQNAAPSITLESAENQGGDQWKLTFDVDDPDFSVNSSVSGFEQATIDLFDSDDNLIQSDITGGALTSAQDDFMAMVDLMGETATEFYLSVTDNGLNAAALSATSDTFSTASAAVPEPASLALWALLGLAAGGYGLQRRRRK